MRQILALVAAAVFVIGCSNPTDPEGWARRALSRARTDEKLEALGHLRKLVSREGEGKDRVTQEQRGAAVDPLVALVSSKQTPAKVRSEAVMALADIGDTRAAKPLVDALDPAPMDREARDLNRRIADALGALRAIEAVPALEALARADDGYTQVAAVDALGKVGDPRAIATLAEIATAEKSEPFTAKKALLAIGQIGDDDQHHGRAAAFRMAFAGTTYFSAASFAAYELGKPMAEPLLLVLEGKESDVTAWARGRGASEGALIATAAQLLGDVGGPEVVPALLTRLDYTDPKPEVQALVRVFAAESLGRLRAREAVRPILELAARESDPSVRDRLLGAVARIGDLSAVPALKAMASAASHPSLRAGPLLAVSRLGSREERSFVESLVKKDCDGPACTGITKLRYEGMLARLDAAQACGGSAACWEGKLEDARAAVRDRAALELGWAGSAKAVPALANAAARQVNDDEDVAARYHALLAIRWITAREPLGPAGGEVAAKLETLAALDRGRTLTEVVNEDAARLAARLRRGR